MSSGIECGGFGKKKLWTLGDGTYEVAPCLSPVLDEGLESAALYAVGEVLDGGADDLVAAAYCEGLRWGLVLMICESIENVPSIAFSFLSMK